MPKRDPKSRRFVQLIEQLAAEYERRHGWKKRVADRLGVHQSYVTKLIAKGSTITVSDDVLRRAARALDIEPRFFSAKSGHYSDFRPDDDLVRYRDQPDFAAALEIAEDLASRNQNPKATEARQIALHISRWAEREMEALRTLRDVASKILTSGDGEAARLGPALAHNVFMRGTPTLRNTKRVFAGIADAKLGGGE